MIFNVGDLLAYGETGVCHVTEIVEKPDGAGTKSFYKLAPVYSSCTIFTPVDNENVSIRPIISAEKAKSLIDSIDGMEPEICFSSSPKQLTEAYDKIIKQHDIYVLAKLIRSIRAKREVLAERKKKLSAIDERYYKKSAELLAGEVACALSVPRDDIIAIVKV